MSEVKGNGVQYRLWWSVAVIGLAAVCLWFGADLSTSSAQVKSEKIETVNDRSTGFGGGIVGTGVGAIPDGASPCPTLGAPLEVMFDASGVSGTLTDVSLDVDITHSWVGDVRATLIAPDATAHSIFNNTGVPPSACFGDSSDLGGLYTFDDGQTGDWWAAATTAGGADPIPLGGYRTTDPGGGTATDMNAAFAAASPTGTWILRVEDGGAGDTGTVNAAELFLTTSGATPASPNVDFDGDGTTDYSQVRDESPGLTGSNPTRRPGSVREKMKAIAELPTSRTDLGTPAPGDSQVWYINSSMSGTDSQVGFGESISDFVVPADYDGDGKADIAVWRPVAASGPNGAFFFVLNSSTSVVDTIDFGQNGDNPTVTGDYDGDGKADPAVFRCPSVAGQCYYFYKGSLGGGGFTTVPWGAGAPSDIFPAPGDFDGDGKYDFNIQRDIGGGQGQFVLLRSSDNGVEFHNWGLPNDFIIPGDFDGDGQADITVGRNEGGLWVWYTLFRAGGINIAQFGASTDFFAPGDYDGDGKTDVAVYRPDPVPANNIFYVFRSSDSMVSGYDYGINFDYPLANWQVN